MATVGEFAKYILEAKPQNNAARLALYHYAKNHRGIGEPFGASMIQEFFYKSLCFEHWRKNRESLAKEILWLAEDFATKTSMDIDFSNLIQPKDIQIVQVTNKKDLFQMLQNFLDESESQHSQKRLLPDGEKGFKGIILNEDRTLKIHSFDSWACIRNGRLTPLATDLVLFYDKNLELSHQHSQHVQITPNTSLRFTKSHDGIRGKLIRGYTFQKLRSFENASLKKIPELFYALKREEKYFIDRATDPFYQEVVSMIEQASALLRTKYPNRLELARAAFERGQKVLTDVFPDDKVLFLLIKELATKLKEPSEKEKSPWQMPHREPYASIDISPSVE